MRTLILFIYLLPFTANALDVGVSVGLSNGTRDNTMVQREYARLKQDVRSLQMLERQLDRLGRQGPPGTQGGEDSEWRQQSEWLLQQSEKVAELAAEIEDYLQEFTGGSANAEFFDYQSAKFKSSQRLDAIEDAAKKYSLKGKAAVERQSQAVKAIAIAY